MSTVQLKSLVAQNTNELHNQIARRILKKRGIVLTKPVRIETHRFLKASAAFVGGLGEEQLPKGATKYLPDWLDRFDDSALKGLERDAKADSIREAAREILAYRFDKMQKLALVDRFSRCSIVELADIVKRHETGFQIAADILRQKIHDSLSILTTEELQKISEGGSTPLVSEIAKIIYMSRKSAPGVGVDLWREQQ